MIIFSKDVDQDPTRSNLITSVFFSLLHFSSSFSLCPIQSGQFSQTSFSINIWYRTWKCNLLSGGCVWITPKVNRARPKDCFP